MSNKTKLLISIATILFFSGCSVYKAASNEGIAVTDITKCRTEGCLLSHGMKIIDRHENSDGSYLVTYRALARKSGATYARAAGHAFLDVATLGLWEVAGTPIESSMSENRGYITAKATYKAKGQDNINKIQIYDVYGKIVEDQTIEN